MTRLFCHLPDNLLHGAVKNAIETGELDKLQRVLHVAKVSGKLAEWECDTKGETVYTMICAKAKRKHNILKVLEFLAGNEPDLNPEKTNNFGKSPLQLVGDPSPDFQQAINRAIKSYRLLHPARVPSGSTEKFRAIHDDGKIYSGLSASVQTKSPKLSLVKVDASSALHASVLPLKMTSENEPALPADMNDAIRFHDSAKSSSSLPVTVETDICNKEKWEVEWRQPVVENIQGLNLSLPDRDKLAEVLRSLREVRLPNSVMKTAFKNGIHIRAAEVPVGEKTAILLWEEVIQCLVSENRSSGQRFCHEIRRVWDLALKSENDDVNRSLKQIRQSIDSGKNCNSKFRRKVKLYKGPKSVDACKGGDGSQLGPKLYSVICERDFDLSHNPSTDEIKEVCLPRSVREDDFTAEKFYAFSSDVEDRIRGGECYASWFPFIVTDEEQSVIQAQWQQPILVQGRSGTGKTTCLVYRLWESYKYNITKPGAGHRPRQVFVSKNPVFVKKVEKYFSNLCRGSGITRTKSKQAGTANQIEDSRYPLFVTAREYFALLDVATKDDEATKCANEARFHLSNEQSYDEERGITFRDLPPDACLNLDWHQDEIWDAEIDTPQQDEVENDAEIDTGTWTLPEEVTYHMFDKEMWKHLVKDLDGGRQSKTLRPELVWKEIKSFIKGTWKALTSDEGHLTEEQYISLGKKQAPDFAGTDQRKQIYTLFKKYKERLQGQRYNKGCRDECDRVRDLYLKLRQKIVKTKFRGEAEEIYIDEVQDFTEAEIAVITMSCSRSGSMFLTGDTAQAVTKGISFRFEDIRQLLREMPYCVGRCKLYSLTENYRSHAGILNMAASIIDILKRHFSSYFNHDLPKDEGRFEGPKPVFLEKCSTDRMAKAVVPTSGMQGQVEFGAYQAIIVRSGKARDRLPEELKLACICLTLFEAKGLEFQDVLLYNFFYDSEANEKDWHLFSALQSKGTAKGEGTLFRLEQQGANRRLLCSELKKFYTAVTRARRKIWVYDDDTSNRKPITSFFRKLDLIEVIDNPSSILEIVREKFSKPSDPSKWEEWGKELEEEGLWDCAAECYEFAGGSCSDKIKFCNANSTISRWRRKDKRVKLEDVVEAAKTLLSINEKQLAAKAYYFAGNLMKAAEVQDSDNKGEAAVRLYKKARDQTNRDRTYSDAEVTEALIKCCKKYHNWEVLVTVLKEEKRFYEAIMEVKNSTAADYQHSKSPTMNVDELLLEATLYYSKSDSSLSRFSEIVNCVSDSQVDTLVQNLHGSKNFVALKLLTKAGKLIPMDTARLCYRSGNLKDAVYFAEGHKEPKTRTFWAHCKSLLLWQERISRTNEDVVSDLQKLADQCHQEKLPDGEIHAKFRLSRLNQGGIHLDDCYRLSVQSENVFGQAISLWRTVSSEFPVSVSIVEVLRTVKIMCDFCKRILQPCSAESRDTTLIRSLERDLQFLGVHIDSQVQLQDDLALWFPTKNENIFLWELLASPHQLKSLCKQDGVVESKRLLSLAGQALIKIACDIMLGTHEKGNIRSVSDLASRTDKQSDLCQETVEPRDSLDNIGIGAECALEKDKPGNELHVEGIERKVDSLVEEVYCLDYMAGLDCRHSVHTGVSEKKYAANIAAEFMRTLNRLVATVRCWNCDYVKQPLPTTRHISLVTSLRASGKKVIELCFPNFSCKLPSSTNTEMIGWGRRMDTDMKTILRSCAEEQWRQNPCFDNLFNIWKIHQLAGDRPNFHRELEDWLIQNQQRFFESVARSSKPSKWLSAEYSKSLISFRDQKGRPRHCLVLWLWIEFLQDSYSIKDSARDFTSAFRALFYLVSFELRTDVHNATTLVLMEIGVALALLVLSKSGRAVAIPSPLVAGYLVLDAAVSMHRKQRLRLEVAVKRNRPKYTDIVWSRHFLSLAAAGVMQYDKTISECEASSTAPEYPQSTRVRRLVLVLTLLCNSDRQSDLRAKCVSILSGSMKQLLQERAPVSVHSYQEILTEKEAINCLREVLESYRPQQCIYRADWNPELKFPLQYLRYGGEFHRYCELLENQSHMMIQERLQLPTDAELEMLVFPYIGSKYLPQFWKVRKELDEEKRATSTTSVERDASATAERSRSLAPVSLLTRKKSGEDRKVIDQPTLADEEGFGSREYITGPSEDTSQSRMNVTRAPPDGSATNDGSEISLDSGKLECSSQDTVTAVPSESSITNNITEGHGISLESCKMEGSSQSQTDTTSEPPETSTTDNIHDISLDCGESESCSQSQTNAIPRQLDSSTVNEKNREISLRETDRELSFVIDGSEAHFSKWLQLSPCLISSLGGEITSPRTDNYVLFPPNAVEEQAAEISYSQYCLKKVWKGDGCLLDVVQLLPHHTIFRKHVDLCIRHHLMLDESSEILVMRSTVKHDNQRTWNKIATLKYADLNSLFPIRVDDDTWVRLENTSVTVSSRHFCETCLVVKGKLQLAVLPYQMVPKGSMNPDEYHLHVYLSCCSEKRIERVSRRFPANCTAEFQGVHIVTVKTSERAPLTITKHFLSEGWAIQGDIPFDVAVEYEDLENHAQNEHLPQKLCDHLFHRNYPAVTQFRLQLKFTSKSESSVVWIKGLENGSEDSTESGPTAVAVSQSHDEMRRDIGIEDIRKLYMKVSHRWKDIARLLPAPGDSGLATGLPDYEIDSIEEDNKENRNECCYRMFHKWKSQAKAKATVLEVVRVLCHSDLGLAEVAKEVFGRDRVERGMSET
jgi:hypothetical protein